MKSKKISIDKLFYNDKFVILFSLLLSLTIWLTVAIGFSPLEERVVKDVPVKIESSQSVQAFDLKIFGTDSFFVDVTVRGKRYLVSQRALTADDIVVVAGTNFVDSAGKYSLKLEIKKKNDNADFDIIKSSEEYIDVYYDVYREAEFPLTANIISESAIVPEGYFKDNEILSEKSVVIGGPATEINKVKKVMAQVTLDGQLSSTKTFEAAIVPVDEYQASPRFLLVNNGNADVTITIPVYKVTNMATAVSFKNSPLFYLENALDYSISPSKTKFGIEESLIENVQEIKIGTVDFSLLKPGENVIKFSAEDVKDAKVLGEVKEFTVIIRISGVTEKRIGFVNTNVSLARINSSYKVELKNINFTQVTLVGPSAVLENITPSDIYAEFDFANEALQLGQGKKNGRLYVKGYDDCWVYGNYTAEFVITEK